MGKPTKFSEGYAAGLKFALDTVNDEFGGYQNPFKSLDEVIEWVRTTVAKVEDRGKKLGYQQGLIDAKHPAAHLASGADNLEQAKAIIRAFDLGVERTKVESGQVKPDQKVKTRSGLEVTVPQSIIDMGKDNKIAAIKELKNLRGLSLVDAKDAIDHFYPPYSGPIIGNPQF